MKKNNNYKNKIKTIIDWIINGFLAFLVIIFAYYFVNSTILKNPKTPIFGYTYFYL